MALHTAFTDLVGCSVPIQLAPMGGVIPPRLIAAVTRAGGMGAVGVGFDDAASLPPVLDAIDAVAEGPYLVNMLIPFLDRAVVEVAASRAKVVDFYHGHPDADLVELAHAGGALVEWQVGSLDDALAAADAGCDLLVVRGVEGGGRMHGEESLWPLLTSVLDRVELPVLAAGGIGNGRGMAAALAAGAAGVRMGTRLVASAEANIHPAYREALVNATGADSVLTDDFKEGWPDERTSSRVLRQSLAAAHALGSDTVGELDLGDTTLPLPNFTFIPPVSIFTGSIEAMPMYAGESVRFVERVESAEDIVRSIAADAERLLTAWS